MREATGHCNEHKEIDHDDIEAFNTTARCNIRCSNVAIAHA